MPINTAPVNGHTARSIAVPDHQRLPASILPILQLPPNNTAMGTESDGRQQSPVHFTLLFASTLHCG